MIIVQHYHISTHIVDCVVIEVADDATDNEKFEAINDAIKDKRKMRCTNINMLSDRVKSDISKHMRYRFNDFGEL